MVTTVAAGTQAALSAGGTLVYQPADEDATLGWVDLDGARIVVAVRVNRQARRVRVDFTGTSAQQSNNFNAPKAVCMARPFATRWWTTPTVSWTPSPPGSDGSPPIGAPPVFGTRLYFCCGAAKTRGGTPIRANGATRSS